MYFNNFALKKFHWYILIYVYQLITFKITQFIFFMWLNNPLIYQIKLELNYKFHIFEPWKRWFCSLNIIGERAGSRGGQISEARDGAYQCNQPWAHLGSSLYIIYLFIFSIHINMFICIKKRTTLLKRENIWKRETNLRRLKY